MFDHPANHEIASVLAKISDRMMQAALRFSAASEFCF
jgi:hypothetical protein